MMKDIYIFTHSFFYFRLENNVPLRSGDWSIDDVARINDIIPQAITLKPIVYLINIDKRSFLRKANKWFAPINEWVKTHGGGTIIPFSVEWEQELWALRYNSFLFIFIVYYLAIRNNYYSHNNRENPEAKEAFLADANGLKSVLPRIVKVGYNVLSLIYFFTAGEDEVRAWTIPAGATAPEAAGTIHTDFERGFIKAEVVAYDDFRELANGKSMAPIKAAGKYRQEGKTYIVNDGDIIHFMFNVTAKKK